MRLIQAGVGGYGSSWLYAVRECNGFEHVALVDPNPDFLKEAGQITGLSPDKFYTSLSDAISEVRADGLIDCTPASCHYDTTTTALRAGLHVLCEKPMSDNMAAARAMVHTAEEFQRTLMVTQQYRYQDQPRFLRSMIADGTIGDIDHLVVEFQLQALLAGWRRTMRHPLIMDMSVHHFDLMRYLLGANALRVQALTWNPSVSNTQGDMNAFIWIEFEGGVRINYTGSFASPGSDTGWNGRWDITGTRGSLVWNQKDDWGPIRLFKQGANPANYQIPHIFTPLPEVWGQPVWASSIGPVGHHYDLYHWNACIQADVEPETSGKDNLHTLALTFAAIKAADSGQVVEVNSI